jgi:hypothetical protein
MLHHLERGARVKIVVGLALIAVSCGQVAVPRRFFDDPGGYFLGFPVIPGGILAYSAAFFTIGVIVLSEGICQRLGAPSLAEVSTRSFGILVRVALGGALAGLILEFLGQWLGKLWIYPWWTGWFYAVVVVPGFAFYWISIVESYLAAKAVADRYLRVSARPIAIPVRAVGLAGALCLASSGALYLAWYATGGGFAITPTRPSAGAPPYEYGLLAVLGLWLGAEWVLSRSGRPSLLGAVMRGYWGPVVAILLASVVLSPVMELPNSVYDHWAYQNFPADGVRLVGVPVMVFVAWPMQYLVLLLLPSLIAAELAEIFWKR